MATGGMLALRGEADESLAQFMGLIEGTDAIRYWNESTAGWADITGATLAKDYTLGYLTEGELAGYTILTMSEPATPVAHWALDETSGTTAFDSAGSHDMTIYGGAAWVIGQINGALEFDGVNDYGVSNSVCADIAGGSFSIAAWIKSETVNPADQFIIALNTHDGGNRILMGTQAGSSTLSVAGGSWHDTGVTVIDGSWHHVAYVVNNTSNTFTVYVDGSDVLSLPSGVPAAADDKLSLGQEYDGGSTGDFYLGLMDDVRVYDEALSAVEIEDIYGTSTLVSHWALDETSGTTAFDSAGNNDGTLIGGPVWTDGQIDGGLSFDGIDDHVTLDGVCDDIAGGNFSIAAWIKSETVNPADQFIIALNTHDGGNRILMGTQAGSSTLSIAGAAWHDTGVTVIDSSWHHVAYVVNNSSNTFTVYVDGSDVLSLPSGVPVAADDLMSLGQEYDGGSTGDFYQGLMDDVRVYDEALFDVDIQLLYYAGLGTPAIGVSSNSFSFTANEGGVNPADQTLTITNTGGGTLDWTTSESCSWLSVSPASGSSTGEGDEVTLSVDITGLLPNSYECVLTVTDPLALNDPQTVDVNLDINGPSIGISANSFIFGTDEGGANPADQTLTITNTGIGTLDWAIIESCPWLSVSPASGSTTDESDDVTLSVDVTGMTAGSYIYDLIVSDPTATNGPLTVTVTFLVKGLVSNWELDETSGTTAFDSISDHDGTLVGGPVWTTGLFDGALSFDGVDDHVTIDSIASQIAGSSVAISCWVKSPVINPADQFIIALNTHDGGNRILIGTQAGSSTLGVAREAWNNTGVTVIDDSWHHIVCVLNDGGDKFIVYVDGNNVLSLSSTVSIAADDLFSLGQEYDSGLVTSGFYAGLLDNVKVYSGILSDSAVNLLYYTELDKADIGLSASSFNFTADEGGANPADQTLTITNIGVNTLNWTAIENCSWLNVSPASGSSTGEGDDVTLSVDTTGMTWGQYSCDLVISDPLAVNTPETVTVNLELNGAIIGLSSNSFSFTAHQDGANPPDQTLAIFNIGVSTLDWTASESCDWLSVIPASGSSTGERDEVTLSVDTTGMTWGQYSCDLTISDPASESDPQIVTVALKIDTTFYVPSMLPTIQAAIDASIDVNKIIVAPGTYVENINFGGKNIVLTSVDPSDPQIVASTVIDGNNNGLVVYFTGAETSACELTGFTITTGSGIGGGSRYLYDRTHATISNCVITGNTSRLGGGISYCSGSITNCVISGNSAEDGGGLYECSGAITNCIITDNIADNHGGGFYSCKGTVTNCTITNNIAGERGGGLYNADGAITNCTITGNTAGVYGGGLCSGDGAITNCIFWGNTAVDLGDQLYYNPTPTYSCIQDWTSGGIGNIANDPMFVDAEGGDLRLLSDSLCIDAGDNSVVELDDVDLDGNPRIFNGIVDIGAYEIIRDPIVNYVDDSAVGANDGTSWEDAYNEFYDALDAAVAGAKILVAQGTYKPDTFGLSNPREANFRMKSGVTVEGSYAGYGADDPNDRNIKVYKTILSGDLGIVGDISDNAYHVVTTKENSSNIVLDGFTITAGNWDGSQSLHFGGGIYNDKSSIAVRNCIFRLNSAEYGGGMINYEGSALVTNCTFRLNSAEYGGGMFNYKGSALVTNCIFIDNSASEGGGICNYDSGQRVINCTFVNNSADFGGAVYARSSYPESSFVNCVLADNGNEPFDVPNISCFSYCAFGFSWEDGCRESFSNNIICSDLMLDEDFRLQADSPCIDAGDNSAVTQGTDLGGNARIVDGDGDGEAVVDMGAYEYFIPSTAPAIVKSGAIDILEGVKDGSKTDKELDKAIKHIKKSLEKTFKGSGRRGEEQNVWIDDWHLDPEHGKKVFDEEKKAARILMDIIESKDEKANGKRGRGKRGRGRKNDDGIPEEVKEASRAAIDKLIEADDMLASIAYDEALAGEGDPKVDKELDKCDSEFEKVEKELEKGKYDKAIDHYKHAWEHAQHALRDNE